MSLVMWWTVPAPGSEPPRVIVANESHQGAIHMQIATIGLDIAKNGVGSLRRSQRPESGVKADMPRQLNRPVSPRF
jgi:hypothetical protein